MTEKKPFNFDKWFNIALVVIVVLHLLSLANNIVSISTVTTVFDTMESSQHNPYSSAPYLSETMRAVLPHIVIMTLIGHIISAIIFIVLAYIGLKYIERNPD